MFCFVLLDFPDLFPIKTIFFKELELLANLDLSTTLTKINPEKLNWNILQLPGTKAGTKKNKNESIKKKFFAFSEKKHNTHTYININTTVRLNF